MSPDRGRSGRKPRPPRWVYRTLWALHRAGYAISGGRLGLRSGADDRLGTLRLGTLGRRTGKARAAMLSYLPADEGFAVVASNAGASYLPAWALNLQARPGATVDLPGHSLRVRARVAGPEEHASLWARFTGCFTDYERYAEQAEREILSSSSSPSLSKQMPELRVDAVIFDMDGVVIDSGDVYAKHWRSWGLQHGIDFDAEIAHVHPGRPPLETIRVVAPHLDAEAEALDFNDALDADDGGDAIAAMPGAAALLAGLPPDRWTIATSAFRNIAIVWLEHCGLPVPPALVTVDDIEHGKPAPDPYLRAAELLGVDPARCLVVEDAPAGVQAAKSAGATVLALRTTHGREDLALADHHTRGLHTISATVRDGQIVVSWESAQD